MVVNEIGNRYGKLVVLERAGSDKHRNALWKCQCDCGNIAIVSGAHLRNGFTKSCGCWKVEFARLVGKKNMKDITGQKFGLLTVLYPTDKRAYDNSVIWHCKCDCGRETDVSIKCLINHYTISCGCKKHSNGELKIIEILDNANIPYESEKSFKDLKSNSITNNSYYRYDFYLPSLNILIEYDGSQHYQEEKFCTNTLKERQEIDLIKNKYAINHHYKLYRIPYYDYNKIQNFEDIILEKYLIKI